MYCLTRIRHKNENGGGGGVWVQFWYVTVATRMVIGNKKGVASRGNTEYFGGEGGGVMIPVALYGFEKNRKGYFLLY